MKLALHDEVYLADTGMNILKVRNEEQSFQSLIIRFDGERSQSIRFELRQYRRF